jgi:hypothetical protein
MSIGVNNGMAQGGSQLIDFGIGLENRPHDFLLPAEALAAPYFQRVTLSSARHQADMPHTPNRNGRSTGAFSQWTRRSAQQPLLLGSSG